jgi:hypothetical protein
MTIGKGNRLRDPNQLAARTEVSNLNAAASVIDLNECRRTHLRKTKHRSQLSIRLTNGMISLEMYSIQVTRPGLQRTSKV